MKSKITTDAKEKWKANELDQCIDTLVTSINRLWFLI